jgi:hypothetical protein
MNGSEFSNAIFSIAKARNSANYLLLNFVEAPPRGTTETLLDVNKMEISSDLKSAIFNFWRHPKLHIVIGSVME